MFLGFHFTPWPHWAIKHFMIKSCNVSRPRVYVKIYVSFWNFTGGPRVNWGDWLYKINQYLTVQLTDHPGCLTMYISNDAIAQYIAVQYCKTSQAERIINGSALVIFRIILQHADKLWGISRVLCKNVTAGYRDRTTRHIYWPIYRFNRFDGLMQRRSDSIANTLQLRLFCI